MDLRDAEQMASDGAEVTTTELKLDDLFYDYEDVHEDGLDSRKLVATYKEFQTEKTQARLTRVPRGFFFPYQEQQTRYMLHRDRLLGLNEPGTGKTFAAIMAAEMYRGNYNPSLPRDPLLASLPPVVRQYLSPTRTNIRRTIYLTVNHVLDRQAMNTISIVRNTNGITHSDEEWYIARSYGTFLTQYTKLYKKTREADIARGLSKAEADRRAMELVTAGFRQEYSDTFFILDEAHRLSGENLAKIASGKNLKYRLIHLLLKSIERSPVVVFTATPISNNTSEVIPILNLILDEENEIPLTTNLDKMSESDLDQLLRTRCYDNIFYISANPSGINIVYEGIPLPPSPFSYVPCEMEGKQLEQYLMAMKGELKSVVGVTGRGIEIDKEDVKRDSLNLAEAMAGLCWSPLDCVTSRKGRGTVTIREPVSITIPDNSPEIEQYARQQEAAIRSTMGETSRRVAGEWAANYTNTVRELVDVKPYLFDTKRMAMYGEKPENWMIDGPEGNNLRQRSSKYYKMLHQMTDPVEGNQVFLGYFRFREGSGSLRGFTAIALLNGYERYDDTLSDVASGTRIVGLTKKRRLIVLTPEMKSATIRLWLNIVAHADNVNGEYINAVLISPGMKIGIEVFSTRVIFHTSPDWSPWGEEQALFRGLREGGATEIQKHLGIYPDGLVDVHLNLLAATFPSNLAAVVKRNGWGPLPPPKNNAFMEIIRPYSLNIPHATIDEDMYHLISDKYRRHFRVISRLRSLAVTCSLNTARNKTVDCVGTCCEDMPIEINSFNVLYTGRHTWALKQYITRRVKGSREPVHIADLISSTRDYQIPLQTYYQAIFELIQEKSPIINELGIPLYLNFDRERVYLDREYPMVDAIRPNWLHSYYANHIPITYSTSEEAPEFNLTTKIIEEIQEIKDVGRLRALIMASYSTVEKQMVILERALVDTLDAKLFPNEWRGGKWGTVLQVYYVYWGWFSRPIDRNIVLAQSFVSFWHEAGYPIISRLRNPSRYRYYTIDQKEWRMTHERSRLVETIRHVYSEEKVRDLFQQVQDYPIGIETICDSQFRVILGESGDNSRGRMINSLPYLELTYILILLGHIPSVEGREQLGAYTLFSPTDIDSSLREELLLFSEGDEERRVEVTGLLLDIADQLSPHYTKRDLTDYIRNYLRGEGRVIDA